MKKIVSFLRRFNSRVNKYAPTFYTYKLKKNEILLDVGCGNNSPQRYKNINKNILYFGIDIKKHNQNPGVIEKYADKIILTKPEEFHDSILKAGTIFSLIISSHNIEHCEKPREVIDNMCISLKKDGILYMAFPCEESKNFPSREGTLNFYDDPTHISIPIFNDILNQIKTNNLEILIEKRRRRFLPLYILGFLREKNSHKYKKVFRGTWDYWGFESIIVAKKK